MSLAWRGSRFSRSSCFMPALVGRQTGALARITPAWRTQLLSVSGVQPIFAAIDLIDIHCVG